MHDERLRHATVAAGTPVIYVNPTMTPEELAANFEKQLRLPSIAATFLRPQGRAGDPRQRTGEPPLVFGTAQVAIISLSRRERPILCVITTTVGRVVHSLGIAIRLHRTGRGDEYRPMARAFWPICDHSATILQRSTIHLGEGGREGPRDTTVRDCTSISVALWALSGVDSGRVITKSVR
ncbi:hypothetical protein PHK61_31140 [Actinomycetospora lutea]|uniref:hypothetical protein n=1 Tax=Actinomycetospora lutea TaxID=663604 RepID=UPI002365837F|nr:hypothetical protein [Actinomycetospora lutea]MDD7942877.1 hypothetical protein [Actinomycetospora lutea]